MTQSNAVLYSDILITEVPPCESSAISEYEELAKYMTFQVAMMMPDFNSWVLASDTRVFLDQAIKVLEGSARTPPDIQAPTFLGTHKIVCHDDANLIYAMFGQNAAKPEFAGATLIRELGTNSGNIRDALRAANAEANQAFPQADGGLLAIYYKNQPQIWSLEFEKGLMEMLGFGYGGGGNLAMYLTQRFYRPVAATKDFQKLKMLAALSVLEAHHCNPSVVEGLEMCWSENGEPPRHATPEEIAELAAKSETLMNAAIIGLF